MTTDASRWACPACAASGRAQSAFCSACGEAQPGTPPPRWTAALSRWWRMLKLLSFQPGELTRAWLDGRRKPLAAPLTLFLGLNVVFFLSQTLSGVAMLLISLSAQFQNQGYSALANHWVDQHVSKQAVGRDRCQVTFDLRQQTLGKAGVIALVPPFEALCAVALWRRRGPLHTHSIFALHFYSFSMSLMFLLIALVGIAANAWAANGRRVYAVLLNNIVSLMHLLAIARWLPAASTA